MRFSKTLYEKMQLGDRLTDDELACAASHFIALESMLLATGPEWSVPARAAIHEANRLRDIISSRKRQGTYKPVFNGTLTVTWRHEEARYTVDVPDFPGGQVLTLEVHEALMSQARSDRQTAG